MDYKTYQQIRAYCWQDLAAYIDTPVNNTKLKLSVKLAGGGTAELKHEQDCAVKLYQCKDLTPRENNAAHLLAVISNHRAITWHREPAPPEGLEPAPPLTKQQHDTLEGQTLDAIKRYAAFIPEREAAALLETYAEVKALPITQGDKTPAKTENNNGEIKPWEVADPKDPATAQPWYTPARYFARQLVKDDSTLLTKRNLLASKTSQSLASAGIYKRGGKKPPDAASILKAFNNTSLG